MYPMIFDLQFIVHDIRRLTDFLFSSIAYGITFINFDAPILRVTSDFTSEIRIIHREG